MRALPALFMMLLTVMSASEDKMQNRVKSVSGLPEEEAKRLVDKVWKDNQEYDYDSACVMVADMDSDSREEAIVAIAVAGKAAGFIAIFCKEQEDYRLVSQVDCDGSPEGLRIIELLGDGKKALVVEPVTTRGSKFGRESVQVYLWDEDRLVNIWEGATSEDELIQEL